jgi:5'(3')-deoxyribonucleotidase
MKIGIDLDGVCYPFVDEFRNWIAEQRDYRGEHLPALQWNFFEDWGMTAKEFNAEMRMAHEHDALWRFAHPTEGTLAALAALPALGHSIHIVTHRPDYAKATTERWLRDQGIPHRELIFAEDKTKWGLDVLLDDAPHNIEQARAAGIRAITFDQPWNEHVTGERVKSWSGFVAAIKDEAHPDWVAHFDGDFGREEFYGSAVHATPEQIEDCKQKVHEFLWDNPHYHDWTPMPPPPPRAELLDEAKNLIVGDRNVQYGPPTKDFERTAALWSAYKGVEFSAHDVAVMMILLKTSRLAWSPEKRDHWADIAGYAGCGYETTITLEDD